MNNTPNMKYFTLFVTTLSEEKDQKVKQCKWKIVDFSEPRNQIGHIVYYRFNGL